MVSALYTLVGLLAINLVVVVSALPRGFTTFFDTASCPEGWEAVESTKGRLIVSVGSAKQSGITVNSPLGDREDRTHTHKYSATVVVPAREIASIGCCNREGAQHGNYIVANETLPSTSGYPFAQILLCSYQRQDKDPQLNVAYGTIAYFDTTVEQCPKSWVPVDDANGRFLVPGYPKGGAVMNKAPSLYSGEDRLHSHSINFTFPTKQVSFVGAEKCCDDAPGNYQDLVLKTETEKASTRLPYIQMLTCMSQSPSFNMSLLPSEALVFNGVSCPPGYITDEELSGRMLVGLPDGGAPGASFGGPSLDANGTSNPSHFHGVVGSVTLPSVGVGLASGCCGDGYVAAATYPFIGVTSKESEQLPYTMVPLCRSIKNLRKQHHNNRNRGVRLH